GRHPRRQDRPGSRGPVQMRGGDEGPGPTGGGRGGGGGRPTLAAGVTAQRGGDASVIDPPAHLTCDRRSVPAAYSESCATRPGPVDSHAAKRNGRRITRCGRTDGGCVVEGD